MAPWRPSTIVFVFVALALVGSAGRPGPTATEGSYAGLEYMDARRIILRVHEGAILPPDDAEIMLDGLKQWKWRVEMGAAQAAILVTFSHCPHGLGLLPAALGWEGGGRWRAWPGTFEAAKGAFTDVLPGEPAWTALSWSKACKGSAGSTQLAQEPSEDLAACHLKCDHLEGCAAVDFFKKKKICILYDKACETPSHAEKGASAWHVHQEPAKYIHMGEYTFLAAQQWCQQEVACRGFSYQGAWSDKDREGGIARTVYFSGVVRTVVNTRPTAKHGEAWHSYVARENPRANCNPEGPQFECPTNPYACLGLSIDADKHSIKQAYRALSRKMHPDKMKAADRTAEAIKKAEAAFRDIASSHELLSDAEKRREVDRRLTIERKHWEEKKAHIQDIYIKEPFVTSLEPESYPVLLPKAQEWLVHFFLPKNDDCRQMKMAFSRAVTELGTGEDERGEDLPTKVKAMPQFKAKNIYRGTLRERSSSLRNEGAKAAEGDVFVVLIIKPKKTAQLVVAGETLDVKIQQAPEVSGQKPRFSLISEKRIFTGSFDSRDPAWFRGSIANADRPDDEVASFAVQLDVWSPRATDAAKRGGRSKARLYGAVNCGRFPDFCKRKGVDPTITKRFPQVRMLFPDETRFEVYRGRPVGREVVAFAREASRPRGELQLLDANAVAKLEGTGKSRFYLVLLHRDTSAKAALDCLLCKTVHPVLRRTTPRLLRAGVVGAWANCTADEEFCQKLAGSEDTDSGEVTAAEWGTLRLIELGGASPVRAVPLWDSRLIPGDVGIQGLLAALEAAARMAEFLRPMGSAGVGAGTTAAPSSAQDPANAEL